MSRPRLSPRAHVHVTIPEDVYTRTQLALVNPVDGRPRYGAISALITALLRDWLQKQPVHITLANLELDSYDATSL